MSQAMGVCVRDTKRGRTSEETRLFQMTRRDAGNKGLPWGGYFTLQECLVVAWIPKVPTPKVADGHKTAIPPYVTLRHNANDSV